MLHSAMLQGSRRGSIAGGLNLSLEDQAKAEAQRAAIKKIREDHLLQMEAKNASSLARKSSTQQLAQQYQAAMPAVVCRPHWQAP